MNKKPTDKKEYWVYFEQVNQTRWVVMAKSKEEAVVKARRQWRAGFSEPIGISVEGPGMGEETWDIEEEGM